MRTLALVAAGLVATAVLVAAGGTAGPASVRLQPFRSCGELLDYAKANAAKGGTTGGPPVAARSADGNGAAPDYSTTNVQEGAVDEPDLVKTDGTHVFVTSAGKLVALDARAQAPRVLDSLPLEQAGSPQLLLWGTRLLVISGAAGTVPPPAGRATIAPYPSGKTDLTEVDVRDPSALRVLGRFTADGSYVTARLTGSTARVVVTSVPRAVPVAGAAPGSGIRSVLPSGVLVRTSGAKRTRPLVQCRAVLHPRSFSGLGLTTVLTIDLAKGPAPVDADALMASAGPVYASAGSLYLASQRWLAVPLARPAQLPQGLTTEIDQFDIAQPDRTTYRASGTVPGFLLDQWSLSEDGGYLRVASTDMPTWWESPGLQSQSFVSVLADREGKLVDVGRVGGLGHGERIYAARFIGDVGYLVTFRQVDPLYTLDLSNPTKPSVAGSLDLLGYSAYLHPVGNDRLLGIGRDATPDGRVVGTQVSLFDISNLAKPTRVGGVALGQGSSEVEYDHHAFLYWPPTGTAVVPVQLSGQTTQQPSSGAVVLHVSRGRIAEQGRIAPPASGGGVRRSLVVGNRLLTVSDQGVEFSDLATLHKIAWLQLR